MKILLGTDIALDVVKKGDLLDSITVLLKWVNLIGGTCYIDMPTIAILTHFIPLDSFKYLSFLKVFVEIKPKVQPIIELENSVCNFKLNIVECKPLMAQLNRLFYDADVLVTDNQITHNLARLLQIDDKVFTTEEFVEKCSNEHREKDDTIGVAISKVRFGSLDLEDSFFDDFKRDYSPYYKTWFRKKSNDEVYIALDKTKQLRGLLKLKLEDIKEDYSDIKPLFKPAQRLKICSFKAHFTAQKLGQRFMRIVFETAMSYRVDEIYVTIFANSIIKGRLIGMLEQWGFKLWGKKSCIFKSSDKEEEVYVRNFRKNITLQASHCFPYHTSKNRVFLLPIYKSYASMLIPPIQVIGEKEIDIEPVKQAIRKVVIVHNDNKEIREGSVLLFYQKSESIRNGHLLGVGIVERVYREFHNENQFINRCKKRSTLLSSSLRECWLRAEQKPIVIEFLYAYYFKENISGEDLIKVGINISDKHSQHLIPISPEKFHMLINNTNYEKNFIVD